MMIGKCININYTLRKDTFTLRGWLFWYWLFSLKKIYKPMGDVFCIGIRIFGFFIQRVGR